MEFLAVTSLAGAAGSQMCIRNRTHADMLESERLASWSNKKDAVIVMGYHVACLRQVELDKSLSGSNYPWAHKVHRGSRNGLEGPTCPLGPMVLPGRFLGNC